MTLFCRFSGGIGPTPCHYSCAGEKTAFKNFIPSYHLAVTCGKGFCGVFHHVVLKFLLGCAVAVFHKSEFLDLSLTFRAFLPAHFGTFVTSEMNVFRWENVHNLFQDIVDEFQRFGVAGA